MFSEVCKRYPKIQPIFLGQISPTLCSMHYTMRDNSFEQMTVYVVSCWSNLTYTVGTLGVIAAAHTLYHALSLCTRQYCCPCLKLKERIPYSGKLLREKTSMNITVLWIFAKVFSTKIVFSPNRERFLPQKFPAIWYATCCVISVQILDYLQTAQ